MVTCHPIIDRGLLATIEINNRPRFGFKCKCRLAIAHQDTIRNELRSGASFSLLCRHDRTQRTRSTHFESTTPHADNSG